MLAIEGTVVTIDAMGAQKAIAAKIIDRKADYLLALKGNQETLHQDAAEFFADPVLAAGHQAYRIAFSLLPPDQQQKKPVATG